MQLVKLPDFVLFCFYKTVRTNVTACLRIPKFVLFSRFLFADRFYTSSSLSENIFFAFSKLPSLPTRSQRVVICMFRLIGTSIFFFCFLSPIYLRHILILITCKTNDYITRTVRVSSELHDCGIFIIKI